MFSISFPAEDLIPVTDMMNGYFIVTVLYTRYSGSDHTSCDSKCGNSRCYKMSTVQSSCKRKVRMT